MDAREHRHLLVRSGVELTAAETASFTDALNLVSAVANIKFALSTALTLPSNAIDIVRSTTSGTAFTSATYTYSTALGMGLISSATTTIDTNVTGWKALGSFSVSGGYGRETVLHEMLTALAVQDRTTGQRRRHRR